MKKKGVFTRRMPVLLLALSLVLIAACSLEAQATETTDRSDTATATTAISTIPGSEARTTETPEPGAAATATPPVSTIPSEETPDLSYTGPLSATEREGILFMREEEKLARDVYSRLYEIWGTNIFGNITSSEENHMASMKSLIDEYDLVDPARDMDTGQFENKELQDLYDRLVEKGRQSELDALEVGAAIEEIDIIDLEEYLAATERPDIVTVYENLLKGSRNHLRSFVSVIERRGTAYEPQYLTQEAFDEIIGTPMETGKH